MSHTAEGSVSGGDSSSSSLAEQRNDMGSPASAASSLASNNAPISALSPLSSTAGSSGLASSSSSPGPAALGSTFTTNTTSATSNTSNTDKTTASLPPPSPSPSLSEAPSPTPLHHYPPAPPAPLPAPPSLFSSLRTSLAALLPQPYETYVADLRKRISKENYLVIVSAFGTLVGSVYGFVVTLSGLLLIDASFVLRMGGGSSSFVLRFIVLFYLGEIAGALLSFLLSDIFGRKTTIVYCSALCIVLLLWTSLVADGTDLLTSRFFLGLGLGLIMAVSPVYISECSLPADRGKSVGMLSLTSSAGALMACFMYFSLQNLDYGWRIAYIIPMVVLVAKIVGLMFLPESPRWILAHRTPAECLESMRQLRRSNDVSAEFHDIYQALSSDARLGESWVEILGSKSIRYRLFVACALQLSHQLVGIEIVTTFGSYLLGLLDMHSIVLGLVLAYVSGAMGTLLSLSKIDTWGRRFLLICGCLSICLSWLGACVCVYVGGLEEGKAELYFQSYVLRFLFGSFLCLFSFSYSFGVEGVSWIVSAELFPLRARGRASSLTTACHGSSAVIISAALAHWYESSTTAEATTIILLFASYALMLALFVFVALPETNGLMLEEMEELFDVGAAGCCPDWKTGLIGLRALTVKTASNNKADKDSSSHAGPNLEPFEPSTLHKYSGGMRETRFEYFTEEEAPLVPAFHHSYNTYNNTMHTLGSLGGSGSGSGGGGGIASLDAMTGNHNPRALAFHPHTRERADNNASSTGGLSISAFGLPGFSSNSTSNNSSSSTTSAGAGGEGGSSSSGSGGPSGRDRRASRERDGDREPTGGIRGVGRDRTTRGRDSRDLL